MKNGKGGGHEKGKLGRHLPDTRRREEPARGDRPRGVSRNSKGGGEKPVLGQKP